MSNYYLPIKFISGGEDSISYERGTALFNIVLIEPEIPMNTGNIARTCAATGTRLHLVGPLGFDISDRAVKRAGLDYWWLVDIIRYESTDEFFDKNKGGRFFYLSTKAPKAYTKARFQDGDFLVFGKETRGLPEELIRKNAEMCFRIPMREEARSLNLANSVAIVLYEALRQTGFDGLLSKGSLVLP